MHFLYLNIMQKYYKEISLHRRLNFIQADGNMPQIQLPQLAHLAKL